MQSVTEKSYLRVKGSNGLSVRKNGTPRPARWTVDEYYKMYDAGLFRNKRVQLIRGEIIEMAPMKSPHATSVQLAHDLLAKVFQSDFVIRQQLPMRFSIVDEPEPDVAVVEGSVRHFTDAHPTTAKLIVEVSDSSLRFDRKNKAELYAENGIEEYWIVNLKDRCVEIHRSPSADSQGTGFHYTEIFVVNAGETISPLAKPKSKIKVKDILP